MDIYAILISLLLGAIAGWLAGLVMGSKGSLIRNIIIGIIGSIIPILITVFGYRAMYHYFGGVLFSPVIRLLEPLPLVINTSLVILIIGILVGMLGSYRAVRRYIKV